MYCGVAQSSVEHPPVALVGVVVLCAGKGVVVAVDVGFVAEGVVEGLVGGDVGGDVGGVVGGDVGGVAGGDVGGDVGADEAVKEGVVGVAG